MILRIIWKNASGRKRGGQNSEKLEGPVGSCKESPSEGTQIPQTSEVKNINRNIHRNLNGYSRGLTGASYSRRKRNCMHCPEMRAGDFSHSSELTPV